MQYHAITLCHVASCTTGKTAAPAVVASAPRRKEMSARFLPNALVAASTITPKFVEDRTDGQQLYVTIPENVYAGEEMQVTIDGQTRRVTVPQGKWPGARVPSHGFHATAHGTVRLIGNPLF